MSKKGPIPRTPGIYLIRNAKDVRVYVGSAIDLLHRWLLHKSMLRLGKHHNPALQNAWNTHGERAFSFEIIEHVTDACLLLKAEQKWLDEYGAGTRRSYNCLLVAGSHLGRKRSEETRKKLSLAKIGKKHTRNSKLKMRAAKIGKKLTLAHRKKIGDAHRGRKLGPRSEKWAQQFRKLKPNQIRQLRTLAAAGATIKTLSRKFKIGRTTVGRYINRESASRL